MTSTRPPSAPAGPSDDVRGKGSDPKGRKAAVAHVRAALEQWPTGPASGFVSIGQRAAEIVRKVEEARRK
jgi:hypothetical protein